MTDTKHGAGPPPAPPVAGDVTAGQAGDALQPQPPAAGVGDTGPRVAPTVIEEQPGAAPPNDETGGAQPPWLGPGKTQPGEPPLIDPVPAAIPPIVPGHFPIPPEAPVSQPDPQALAPYPEAVSSGNVLGADPAWAAANVPGVTGGPAALGVDPPAPLPPPGPVPAAPASGTPWGLIIGGAVAAGLVFGGLAVATLLLLSESSPDSAAEEVGSAIESAEVVPDVPASARPTPKPRPRRRTVPRRAPRPRPTSTTPRAQPAPSPARTAAPSATAPAARRRPPRRRQ